MLTVLAQMALTPPAFAVGEPDLSCSVAGRTAEVRYGIPTGMLDAIGRVESGRGSAGAPWPWTVNAGGTGRFFETSADAAAWVAEMQGRGVRLIDVGCFQMDLFWHPGVFASVADALDPVRNAEEAARFLADLHRQTGDWPAAVARYHSANPGLGIAYSRLVIKSDGSAAFKTPVGGDPFVIALLRAPAAGGQLPHVVKAGFP